MAHLYCWTNKNNGKQYFGIGSKSPEVRKREHLKDFRYIHRKQSALSHALRKHGLEAFLHEVLLVNLDWESACFHERMCIAIFRSKVPFGYNKTEGGDGSLGVIPSEETRKKMSKAQSGRKHSSTTREKMSSWQIGRKMSDEARANMSLAKRGQNIGRVHSEETKERIRQKNVGKVVSQETKDKLSKAKLGVSRLSYSMLVNAAIMRKLGALYSSLGEWFGDVDESHIRKVLITFME